MRWGELGGTLTRHAFALVFDSVNRLYDWLRKGSVGRLPRRFLLAVTSERVHVFKEAGPSVDEVAVFDRHRVWLRRAPAGRIWLCTTQDSRVHEIVLDGSLLEVNPGAAEVLAALPEHHANEAGLSA